MMFASIQPTPKIVSVVDKYAKSGLFTHVYASYSSFGQVKSHWEYSLLPDQRNIFDLASLTKACVTTPLIFAALHEQQLTLDTSMGDWLGKKWPSNLNRNLSALKLKDLLKHTSGLPAWRNFWIGYWDESGYGIYPKEIPVETSFDRHIIGLNHAADHLGLPGSQVYSDVGFILLGLCLAITQNSTLEILWNNFLLSYLGIDPHSVALTFSLNDGQKQRAIPTGYCALRKRQIVGEVHDENCASLGGFCGHAGLFGTGSDLNLFLIKLLGSEIGQKLITENSHVRGDPNSRPPPEGLLGWRQGADPSSFGFGDGMAMGHMGFTGVAFWLRPEYHDFAILLTNRVISGRFRKGIADFRREFFSAIVDQSVK